MDRQGGVRRASSGSAPQSRPRGTGASSSGTSLRMVCCPASHPSLRYVPHPLPHRQAGVWRDMLCRRGQRWSLLLLTAAAYAAGRARAAPPAAWQPARGAWAGAGADGALDDLSAALAWHAPRRILHQVQAQPVQRMVQSVAPVPLPPPEPQPQQQAQQQQGILGPVGDRRLSVQLPAHVSKVGLAHGRAGRLAHAAAQSHAAWAVACSTPMSDGYWQVAVLTAIPLHPAPVTAPRLPPRSTSSALSCSSPSCSSCSAATAGACAAWCVRLAEPCSAPRGLLTRPPPAARRLMSGPPHEHMLARLTSHCDSSLHAPLRIRLPT